MTIPFTKMHGLGNDYLYVNGFDVDLTGVDLPALSRRVSDRHRGVGSDGLILIVPPTPGIAADVRMEMYNADGSRGEMCGNGIRCVAKYAIERGLVGQGSVVSTGADDAQAAADLRVQTDRGMLELKAFGRGGRVERVRVDMGPPILSPLDIPVAVKAPRCVRARLPLAEGDLSMTCVSMGNPHAVVFLDDLGAVDLATVGPEVEHHALFPQRVNFHLARADGRREATMRTWERGSGITQACGTGACAVLVAGVLEERLDRAATLHLPGGDLEIEWPEKWAGRPNSVFMTGPAVEVFSGHWAE